jgi:hypothetical protein
LVRELWIINAIKRTAWVYKKPNADGTWGNVEQKTSRSRLAPDALTGLSIVLEALD